MCFTLNNPPKELLEKIKTCKEENLKNCIGSFIYNRSIANQAIAYSLNQRSEQINDLLNLFSTTLPTDSATHNQRLALTFLQHYYAFHRNDLSPIEAIRKFALIFLAEYSTATQKVRGNGVDYPFLTNEHEREHLANIAVSTYLEYWMEQSPECRTTTETYLGWGYKLPTDSTQQGDRSEVTFSDTRPSIKCFRDARLKAYREMQHLQDLPQSTKTEDLSSYHFLDFSFTSAWKHGGLSLLKYTLFDNRIPSRKSARNVQQNEALEDAWNKHYQYLKTIERKYISGQNMQIREYVIDCILMQKIEKANHFQAFNQIAQQRNTPKKTVKLTAELQALANLYWGAGNLPEKYNFSFLFPSITYSDSWDITDFQSKIALLYSAKTQKEIYPAVRNEFLRRGLMIDLMNSIYLVFPLDSMPKWNQKLFDQAASFYHDKYNFIKEWIKQKPPTIIESPGRAREAALLYYDRVYEIYRDLLKWEDSTMGQAIAIGTAQKQQQK